jgi:type VI secretion system protein ImpK
VSQPGLGRIAGDYITLVQLIQQAPPNALPDAGSLRTQLLGLLDQISTGGHETDASQEELDEARFALTVWADEVILRSQWPGREQWQHESLQQQLFRTSRGGNEFYEHLAKLRPEHSSAREIYFLVLSLGFEGQYALQPDQRTAVITHQFETLRAAGRALEATRESPVTPSAYEVEIELPRASGGGVLSWLGMMLLGLAAVYGLVWAALYLLSGDVPVPRGG